MADRQRLGLALRRTETPKPRRGLVSVVVVRKALGHFRVQSPREARLAGANDSGRPAPFLHHANGKSFIDAL